MFYHPSRLSPYGYFRVRHRSPYSQNRPRRYPPTVEEHFIDEVKYLVAIPPYMSRRSNFGNRTMVRSHVTQERGIVPPGSVYHEACRSEQLVPPRYAKFFPEGSCFLPDFTALQLISNQCHFIPKKVDISYNSTFFLHAEHEGTTDLKFLANFLKEVDSFTGHDKGVSSKLLGLILSNASPKLAALDISANRIPEMTPILTSVYNRIMELSVEFHPKYKRLLDLSMFISILEYHSLLHTISISIKCHLNCLRAHTCFKKPNLCHLKLKFNLEVLPTDFLCMADFVAVTHCFCLVVPSLELRIGFQCHLCISLTMCTLNTNLSYSNAANFRLLSSALFLSFSL